MRNQEYAVIPGEFYQSKSLSYLVTTAKLH